MSKSKNYFAITYEDPKDGTILKLDAGCVMDSTLGLGFVAISEFLFNKNQLVVTPDEEALMKRLENVTALHLSMHSILSICEIGQEHAGLKFKNDKSKLLVLPGKKN